MKTRELTTGLLFRRLSASAAALVLSLGAARVAPALGTNYPPTVLSNNPSAYYRFEETTNGNSYPSVAVDSSTNNNNGTYDYNGEDTSPLLGLPGIDTNSIQFQIYNGSLSDYGYVDVPNAAGLTPANGVFSTELWVQPQASPGAGGWMVPFEVAQYPNGWNFYVSGTGEGNGNTSYFYLNMHSAGVFQGFGNFPITFFQWYHLALTFDGTNAITYIDGQPQATNVATGYVPAAGADGHIGSGQGIGWNPFVGGIDEFAFYTNILSPAEIANDYHVGTNSFYVVTSPGSVATGPSSMTNYSGTTATFAVVGQGTAPLSYQWYTNGTAIAGATTTSYSLLAQYPQDNNLGFTVIVSNAYGSQTSAVATLTVLTNLNIVAAPGSITRNVGSHAAFHVTATGAVPIGYQWSVSTDDGATYAVIPNATNQSLWLTNVQLSQNGNFYSISVTNPFGNSSQAATLNVQPRQDPPVPLTGYGAVVAADNPVAYWRLDETSSNWSSGVVAEDAVGTFDGVYTPNAGAIGYGAATGIPHSVDSAVTLAGGATVQVPWVPELNPDTAWSVETWIQPASLGANSGDYRVVLSSEYNRYPYAFNGWYIYQQPSVNNFAFVPQPGNLFITAGPDDPASGNQLVAGNWYHLVVTDDTTNFSMYINGELRTSFPVSGDQLIPNGDGVNADGNAALNSIDAADDGASFVIGQRTDAAFNTFLGTVDDTAVYNYALSPKQVASHYADAVLLTIAKSSANVVLTWPAGVLQASSSLTGVYTNVPSAVSPYTNAAAGAAQYYRVHVP